MQVYINNEPRNDIIPLVGGNLEQNAEHKTTSKISVKLPSDLDKDIRECDYIELVNDDVIVHAGTILGISQQEMGQKDLGFKIYDLTITSNADYISSVLVDLVFPAGASISNVLYGNHEMGFGKQYYNENLSEFNGILEKRILPEEIGVGLVDDFSSFILSEQATLWGSYVDDVLDLLCSTAGAWWEITNDKVFNMRYDISREDAPYQLSSDLDIYDLQTTRDAYTLYSAIRIIGGEGQGHYINAFVGNGSDDIATRVSDTLIKLKYPFYKDMEIYFGDGENVDYKTVQVGIKGVDDNNSSYDYLVSYGGTEIIAKSGKTFPRVPQVSEELFYVNYYPIVPIITRLVDKTLEDEIKQQRGGTGLVEYIYKDNSINDFTTATNIGLNFLKNGSGRAYSITFKTLISGFRVGHLLKNSNIPLYGVSGDYKITSISCETISENIIEYTITASTSAYSSDSLKSLFYNPKKTSFKLGDDFPAVDGILIDNKISIDSVIDITAYNLLTFNELEEFNRTCYQWDLLDYTWKDILGAIKSWNYNGNYLTKVAKKELTNILSGNSTSFSLSIPNNVYLTNEKLKNISKLSTYKHLKANNYAIFDDYLLSQYMITPNQAQFIWNYLYISDISINSEWLQEVAISIENTNYQYSFIIDKIDKINDKYLEDKLNNAIAKLLIGEKTNINFKTNGQLYLYGYYDNGVTMNLLKCPQAISNEVIGNSIITSYYIGSYDMTYDYIKKMVFNNAHNDTHVIAVDIDKRKSTKGYYSLNITKKDEVI